MKTTSIFPFALLFFVAIEAQAQKGPVASGGNATGTGGSMSYSVGQVDYITQTGTGGKATQGLQQPYEIYTVGIEENSITIQANVYPNQTSNGVKLNIESDFDNLQYSLVDVSGKLVAQKNITDKQTIISMADLANGNYILNVYSNTTKVKSFTIIKNY